MAMYLLVARQTKFVSGVIAENIEVLEAGVVGDRLNNEVPSASIEKCTPNGLPSDLKNEITWAVMRSATLGADPSSTSSFQEPTFHD